MSWTEWQWSDYKIIWRTNLLPKTRWTSSIVVYLSLVLMAIKILVIWYFQVNECRLCFPVYLGKRLTVFLIAIKIQLAVIVKSFWCLHENNPKRLHHVWSRLTWKLASKEKESWECQCGDGLIFLNFFFTSITNTTPTDWFKYCYSIKQIILFFKIKAVKRGSIVILLIKKWQGFSTIMSYSCTCPRI